MANGNPFYIHPGGDYSQGLQGLAQTAMRATEMRRKQQATEDAAAKFAAMKAGALEAYRSGDPVKMAEFSLANPEMAQAMKAAMGFYNDATEKNYQDSLFNLYQNPTRDNAAEVVESRQKFLRGQGVPSEQTQETDGFMSRFEENPEGIRVQVGRELAFRYPERFKAMQEATSPAAVLKLTANQKDYKLAKDEGFTGTFMEYQRALKEDPAQDLELQKLKVQIEDIQERREARKQKAEDRKLIKEEKTRGIVSGIDSVLEEVDKA
ncbi:MAG: hypothetical protein GWM98_02085, partial [Nitrospinaceae bacterium]|nr:hypothetical protein [Nitrospinaceae bacterium]